MQASLLGVDKKFERAATHISDLERQLALYSDSRPYTVRVQVDTDRSGQRCGRLVAARTPGVPDTDVGLALLAGEAAYQLRSALDHLIHQLVILNDNAALLESSRRHQFPIFRSPEGYGNRAGGMIGGISKDAADIVEQSQPYNRTASAPEDDPLWVLQDLNNTDKHRLIPVIVTGFSQVEGRDSRGGLFTLTSDDVTLEHDQVFWSFTTENGRYDDVRAEITCAPAFKQAMGVGTGVTLSMSGTLWRIFMRTTQIVEVLRSTFP